MQYQTLDKFHLWTFLYQLLLSVMMIAALIGSFALTLSTAHAAQVKCQANCTYTGQTHRQNHVNYCAYDCVDVHGRHYTRWHRCSS